MGCGLGGSGGVVAAWGGSWSGAGVGRRAIEVVALSRGLCGGGEGRCKIGAA